MDNMTIVAHDNDYSNHHNTSNDYRSFDKM